MSVVLSSVKDTKEIHGISRSLQPGLGEKAYLLKKQALCRVSILKWVLEEDLERKEVIFDGRFSTKSGGESAEEETPPPIPLPLPPHPR